MKSCNNCSWLKVYPNPKRVYPELDFLLYCEQSNVSMMDINQKISKGRKLDTLVCSHWTEDWVK